MADLAELSRHFVSVAQEEFVVDGEHKWLTVSTRGTAGEDDACAVAWGDALAFETAAAAFRGQPAVLRFPTATGMRLWQ